MEPDEAEDVRRLLSYEERTAGGMMTTEPVILPPDATVAEALAHVRNAELTPVAGRAGLRHPAAAGAADRPLLGVAHIQRLLREPPEHAGRRGRSTRASTPLKAGDHPRGRRPPPRDVQPRRRRRSLDEDGRLLGAVTVDDLLDHLLPENWRDHDSAESRLPTAARAARSLPGRLRGQA